MTFAPRRGTQRVESKVASTVQVQIYGSSAGKFHLDDKVNKRSIWMSQDMTTLGNLELCLALYLS